MSDVPESGICLSQDILHMRCASGGFLAGVSELKGKGPTHNASNQDPQAFAGVGSQNTNRYQKQTNKTFLDP